MKIEKCPFCGGESLLRERYVNGTANTKHYIRECHHCKATFAHWFRSIKKANEAWNRRADAVPVVREDFNSGSWNSGNGYQPKKGINEGYQPTKSISTQPPNKGSNVQPAKKNDK